MPKRNYEILRPSELLTIEEVAEALAISVRSVHRLRESGRITPIKCGKKLRFHPGHIDDYVRQLYREEGLL